MNVRWKHSAAALMLGAALAAAATHHLMRGGDVRHPVTAVESGVLYRSGQLEPDELAEEVRRRGIRTVVNLGSRTNWDVDACRDLGVRYVDMPVGDVFNLCGVPAPGYSVAPSPYDLTPLWELVSDPRAQPVLIHCWGGVHRTGVVTAFHRIEHQGWTTEDALAEIRLFGFNIDKSKFSDVVDYLNHLPKRTARAKKNPTDPSDAPTLSPR